MTSLRLLQNERLENMSPDELLQVVQDGTQVATVLEGGDVEIAHVVETRTQIAEQALSLLQQITS